MSRSARCLLRPVLSRGLAWFLILALGGLGLADAAYADPPDPAAPPVKDAPPAKSDDAAKKKLDEAEKAAQQLSDATKKKLDEVLEKLDQKTKDDIAKALDQKDFKQALQAAFQDEELLQAIRELLRDEDFTKEIDKILADDEKQAFARPEREPWTQEKFEEVLSAKPAVAITSAVLKFGPLLIGLLLLGLLYLRNDRIRGGVIPAPPRVTPTTPTSGTETTWLCVGAFFLPIVFKPFLVDEGQSLSLQQTFILMGMTLLPVAFIIVFRRHRLARPKPPGIAKSSALGMGTFCIAIATVVPVSFVWIAILIGMGKPPEVQGLVQQAVDPANPSDPYMIAIYGVLIAPFAEEAIFRGMLYPLGRKLLGGTRRAAITSGVATAALFAAIHSSVTALIPLFVLALVLTWAFERTNSLATVVIAHGLNNLTSLLPLLMYHML